MSLNIHHTHGIGHHKPIEEVIREAELRQWWRDLALTLQRQSPVHLDVLNISLGKVRDNFEQLLRERPGWERWELFIEAVFEVGEDAFVKLVGANRNG